MFLKLNSEKILIKIGYSKQEIAESHTNETDADGLTTVTYSYGSGNSCVECTDEDVLQRLGQLSDYVKSVAVTGDIYNIKWSDSKNKITVNEVEIETHFSGDDTAKDARILADKWTAVRADRDRRLAETDYLALSDQTLSNSMKTYRDSLRDVPEDNADPDNISWPVKP